MKRNKKLLVLNIIVAVLVIFAAVYSVVTGGHYTLLTNSFRPDCTVSGYEVVYTDEDVVKLSDARLSDKDEIILEFDAVGEGTSDVTVTVDFEYGAGEIYPVETRTFTLNVNGWGMITDTTHGLFEFPSFTVVLYIFMLILLLSLITMILVFIDYWKKSDFGYEMVACIGSCIFLGVLLAFLIYKWMNGYMRYFGAFQNAFFEIGYEIFLAISPFMIVMSVLLAISNIWLMKHEGYRPVNALGIVFGILWAGATGMILFSSSIPVFRHILNNNAVNKSFLYIVCYFGSMFIATTVCAYLSTKSRPPLDRDYIIILGCGLRSDGTPMPLLKGRIDAAMDFEKEQFDKTGKHAVFVPSGGQGADEVISESQSMTNYLTEHGVPQERILLEDRSVNTMQNMQFSGEIIKRHAECFEKCKIAFATTNYHIFRGYILAKKNGFEAKGISAKTKKYFYPNAFLREFVGLLVDQKWTHLIFVLLTLAVFVGLSLL